MNFSIITEQHLTDQPVIIEGLVEPQHPPDEVQLLDGTGRLNWQRSEDNKIVEAQRIEETRGNKNDFIIDLTLPPPPDQETHNIIESQQGAEPKHNGIFKRAWYRANLIYATAPAAAALKVAKFFTAETPEGEVKVRKGRVALALAGAAVVAAGVSYVKYKHGVAPSSNNDSHRLVDQLQPTSGPRPKAKSGTAHQHLEQLLPSTKAPQPNKYQILPGQAPYDVMRHAGVPPEQVYSHLTDAAQRNFEITGTPYSWHNYPGPHAYIQVGNSTDTAGVMQKLIPYLRK